MSWCKIVFATVATAAAATVAAGQTPAGSPPASRTDAPPAVYRLRHAAAADAATAVNTFAAGQKLAVVATAEPVSNTVLVAGDAGAREQVADLLTAIDAPPSMVRARMTFVRVPVGFLEEVGLADRTESKWVLTPREARMLAAGLRRTKDAAVLARPELVVADNRTGYVQTEYDAGELSARVTPRLSADGATVRVRLETTLALPAGGQPRVRDIQAGEAADTVPVGGTWVVRGPSLKPAGGPAVEVLVVTTVERVTPPDGR